MKQKAPRIVVMRVSTRDGDRFFYRDRGQRITMAPSLALQGARQGTLKIRTVGDRRCA